MDERQQLLACANGCSSLLNDMARCENEYDYLSEKEDKFKKRTGWVGIGIILGPILALGGLLDMFANPGAFAVNFIGTVICLAITGLSILSIMNHKKRKARMPVVLNELSELRSDPAMSWLPPDYRNSTYARKIIEYLTNMRAKTLQEALNLLETEKHQATMEAIAAVGAMNGTKY